MRYPRDETILVEKADLDEYVEAVQECRREIDKFMAEHKPEWREAKEGTGRSR
ncbi:MAG TPA: hypothetical protein IAB44_04735 [Candidatus Limivivens intestinipullorum]|uniref:Uncharacterized protein n=1 Tax=Candidatus Limivivens intestinipullorum TaxID=2840858 RepID=A0A9D1JJZ8_9FIRM|nr:hypothetical protein [Candidatus Limivivens intestinipullorum]